MGKKKSKGNAGKGEKVFKNLCAVCHAFGSHGATGPDLAGLIGSAPGTKAGFGYSSAMTALSDKTWDAKNLDKYLKSPADYAPGNAMAFAGLPNPKERADLVAYLSKK